MNTSTLQTPLNRGDAAAATVGGDVSSLPVKTLPSDYSVLWWVSRFKQLRTDQLAALVFPEVKSRTTYDRVLKRLTPPVSYQLEKLPTSITNSNVYQLGRDGWSLFNKGRRKIRTTVDFHALAIADVLIHIMQAPGELLEWETEPDCHRVMNNIKLEPDLYVVIKDDPEQPPLHLWLEIDLGGERQRELTDKLERYLWAHNDPESRTMPQVVFLCKDEARMREISSLARRMRLPDGLIRTGLLTNVAVLWEA